MANRPFEASLKDIEEIVRSRHPGGIAASDIRRSLGEAVPLRTLQYRLSRLVDGGRLSMDGRGRWATYRLPDTGSPSSSDAARPSIDDRGDDIVVSAGAASVRDHVRQPIGRRRPVGYDRAFLDGYRPNASFYLPEDVRAHLMSVGRPPIAPSRAGTYAKRILDRLLIDLTWNSSRLEGNTYSLLDTRRLVELGEEAEGKGPLDAQMILNHKDAIEFLVDAADDIGFDRYTLLNLHALLAQNLLADPSAPGRLRYIVVGIERSVFHPLEVPQLIEECFDQVLATASAIVDPFEQAFFAMVHLPYLQPFDDVNVRVSRLAANIPLVRENLAPISFMEVSRDVYTEAVLGVYELNRVDLLRDVFVWAYERSAARYAAVRQSLGEPDPFRLRYRDALRETIAEVVRAAAVRRQDAIALIVARADERADADDRDRFVEVVETELSALHEGSIARYRLRPSEFAAWRDAVDRRYG